MRLFRRVTVWAGVLLTTLVLPSGPGFDSATLECWAAESPGQWDQPAAALVEQISGVVGPGQATLSVRNLSSIPDAQVPAIRTLLEKDLKAHGITIASSESASAVRVTLSQNDRERLWVAEIVQGNETRVVMTEAGPGTAHASALTDYLTLRRERLPIVLNALPGVLSDTPVLSALETGSTMIVLRPDELEVYSFSEGGWLHGAPYDLGQRRSLARDPRGILVASADHSTFTAYSGASECNGQNMALATASAVPIPANWAVRCQKSDEPWPIATNNDPANRVSIKAFYNAARNYFTGVITPGMGVDLPPFYSAALLQRATGTALLIGGIDGKVQIVENGALKPVAGARDWGSDFAVLNSGCGSGAQVIASGSGEAAGDSLRAYELPAQEAVAASAALAMNGAVTALWPAPDGKSLLASVRLASGDYEVDRVTALCN